ncbi:MAG: helix-turn-helix domain-containing protein [Clostridia bacterium]|nr:helix-turn-helix domain-containing protein [Clostridia bacterium]
MTALLDQYHPLTAQPFRRDAGYRELPACEPLRPYVRCFWGSDGTGGVAAPQTSLVTPDTCMDVIFSIAGDGATARFCGVNDRSFRAGASPASGSTFAIRFYAWSARLFADDPDMSGVKNQFLPAEALFQRLTNELLPRLPEIPDLRGRAALAERSLLRCLQPRRESAPLSNALETILETRGRIRVPVLAARQQMSTRHLERLCLSHTGLSPKQLSSLMRYQLLWRELLSAPEFDAQHAVGKYGFADQAHMLNDFRRFHTTYPAEALRQARLS